MNTITFGQMFFRTYFTVFDRQKNRIGMVKLNQNVTGDVNMKEND